MVEFKSYEFMDAASLAYFIQKCQATPSALTIQQIISTQDGRFILFCMMDSALVAKKDLSLLVDQGPGRGFSKVEK